MIFTAAMILIVAVALTGMVVKGNRRVREAEWAPSRAGQARAAIDAACRFAMNGEEAGFEAMIRRIRELGPVGSESITDGIESAGREILKYANRLKEQAP